MTTLLRMTAGAVALVAGLCFLSDTGTAQPDIKTDTYKKAAEADIAFLKTRLGELAALEPGVLKKKDSQRKPAITSAMLLAGYAEAMGDTKLKANALKLAAAVKDMKIKEAVALGQSLEIKPGKVGKFTLPKFDAFDIELAMTGFRNDKTGGLNVEKDIKDMVTPKVEGRKKIVPAEVEVLALRSAGMMEYAIDMDPPGGKYPSGLPLNDANKKLWVKWMKESVDLSKQLAEEAAKGTKADEKKMFNMLDTLNKKCSECHEKFRFEPSTP